MVRAALAGQLDQVETVRDPAFGLQVPVRVPDVPSTLLLPREGWADEAAYDAAAARLASMFEENFDQYRGTVDRAIAEAGPR
jgi:phosphoenolpyruvate carboxykinase (ATP)